MVFIFSLIGNVLVLLLFGIAMYLPYYLISIYTRVSLYKCGICDWLLREEKISWDLIKPWEGDYLKSWLERKRMLKLEEKEIQPTDSIGVKFEKLSNKFKESAAELNDMANKYSQPYKRKRY